MGNKDHHPSTTTTTTSTTSFRYTCCILFTLYSTISSLTFIYWSQHYYSAQQQQQPCTTTTSSTDSFNLLSYPSAWNHLTFLSPPPRSLKIALFVKRWPHRNLAGGLERHAATLHLALARRGHHIHVFTTTNNNSTSNTTFPTIPNLTFHPTPPSPAGYLDQPVAWHQFQLQNTSPHHPFDVVHTESVGLSHGRSRTIPHLAVSWHGIAYEAVHSDIVQDLLRSPGEPRNTQLLADRLPKLIDEVKFFKAYTHHVATSDHVGDVLKRIYMIPEQRVHIIVNGVDDGIYRPDTARGIEFRRRIGVPDNASLVIGMAGRLVKDKGHPLMYQALKEMLTEEDEGFMRGVYVLVAGDGPWGSRYKELIKGNNNNNNLVVLGPLEQDQLAGFYNSLDVFINPTMRAQGLDHTFIEAMMSGVAVMGTRFASIKGSLIVGPEVGYTFSPTVEAVKEALYKVVRDGRGVVRKKGEVGRERSVRLFTATKMAAAYERLFLCISREKPDDSKDYCMYTPA